MATPVIYLTQADSAPIEVFNVKRNGTPVDLTDATVDFLIQNPVTKQLTNSGSTQCEITNPITGVVQYAWDTDGSDTPVVGTYQADLRITYQSGRIETSAVRISVSPHV